MSKHVIAPVGKILHGADIQPARYAAETGLFSANDHVIGVGTASAKKTISLEGFV